MKNVQRSINRRRMRYYIAVSSALLATSALLPFASSPALANSSASHAKTSRGTHAEVTPSADVQLFASKVETLGAAQYADSFVGAVLTPNGVTDVYALPGSDGGLVKAIGAINPSGYRVNMLAASRSYNQLNSLSAKLIAAASSLKSHGVTLARSTPDASTGTVEVSLATPTPSAIAALSAAPAAQKAVGGTVRSANYTTAVSALLSSELGPGFTVESQYSGNARPADRFHDFAPFFGGDSIIGTFNKIPCTGGFFVTGNRSGRAFMLTAGHCSTDFWDVADGTPIGETSTNYWVPGSTNDFQTVSASAGGLPYVYANGSLIHSVMGALLPAVGVEMTFDGAVTGEVPHSTVTAVNATDFNVVDSNSGRTYNVFPVVQATPPPGTVTCQQGDSGGPAYQRTSSNPVFAIGTIAAFFGGPGITILCSAQQIGSEESASNTSLMTIGS
jgi:hypothetical protein